MKVCKSHIYHAVGHKHAVNPDRLFFLNPTKEGKCAAPECKEPASWYIEWI